MVPCSHHQQSWIPTLFTLKCNAFAFGNTLEQSASACGDWDVLSIRSFSHLPLEQALAVQGTCCEPRVLVLLLSNLLVGLSLGLVCAVSIPLPGPSPLLTHHCSVCAVCMLHAQVRHLHALWRAGCPSVLPAGSMG